MCEWKAAIRGSGPERLFRVKPCRSDDRQLPPAQRYRIEIAYLRLKSPQLALRRIAARVRQGGHDVPRAGVLRRFARGWENFQHIYRLLADEWTV